MNWKPKEGWKEGWDVSDIYYARFGQRKDRVLPSELIEAGADALLEWLMAQSINKGVVYHNGHFGVWLTVFIPKPDLVRGAEGWPVSIVEG